MVVIGIGLCVCVPHLGAIGQHCAYVHVHVYVYVRGSVMVVIGLGICLPTSAR